MGIVSRLADPGVESTGASVGLLILRLGASAMMLTAHGWAKLADFGAKSAAFVDPLGDPLDVGAKVMFGALVFAEFFCSVFVAIGLFTRLAVLPLVFAMGVAAFLRHGTDPFGAKELALCYLVAFLTLLFTGAGRFSVDASLAR